METVQASSLFRSLLAVHPGAEVWADADCAAGGWAYFWIVSRFGQGNVRNLAYVRVQGDQLQRRGYDGAGEELWVAAG